jgi:hypothetical protein
MSLVKRHPSNFCQGRTSYSIKSGKTSIHLVHRVDVAYDNRNFTWSPRFCAVKFMDVMLGRSVTT